MEVVCTRTPLPFLPHFSSFPNLHRAPRGCTPVHSHPKDSNATATCDLYGALSEKGWIVIVLTIAGQLGGGGSEKVSYRGWEVHFCDSHLSQALSKW